jgi:hypothetical protein
VPLNYVNKKGREKYKNKKSMDKRLLRCKRRREERRMIKNDGADRRGKCKE